MVMSRPSKEETNAQKHQTDDEETDDAFAQSHRHGSTEEHVEQRHDKAQHQEADSPTQPSTFEHEVLLSKKRLQNVSMTRKMII